MPCIDSAVIHQFAGGCFLTLLVSCWILGRSKRNHATQTNAHAIFLFVDLMCLWYFGALYGSICVEDWLRDDGYFQIPVFQIIIGTTLTTIFTGLITYKPQAEALMVLLHVCLTLISNALLLLSIMSPIHNDRVFWMWATIVFFTISIIHVFRESHANYLGRPNFVRMIVSILVIYKVIYVFTFIWSPFHQNIISLVSMELILMLNNLCIAVLLSILHLQYGYSLIHNPQSQLFKVGNITNLKRLNPNLSLMDLRLQFHTRF